MPRALELLTLDMKVLGLGRQGHEVAGGVDSSPEAAQPSPLGSGREVRPGNRALQQVVQVLSNLIICVRWKEKQKREGSAALLRGTPRPRRAPKLCLSEGRALLAAQSNNVELVPAARWTDGQWQQLGSQSMAAAAPLFLHYSAAWDTGCQLGPKWGSLQVPPG